MEKEVLLKKIKRKYFSAKKNIYKDKYKNLKQKYDFLYGILNPCYLNPAVGNLRKYQIELTKYANNWFQKFAELNIKYFLISGNLLGAFRNGGFLPWDDDFDIGMFRKDYEKLKNFLRSNFQEIPTSHMSYNLSNKYKIIEKYITTYPNETLFFIDHFHIGIAFGKNIENYKLLEIFPYDYYNEKTTIEDYKNIVEQIKSKIKNCNYDEIYNFISPKIKEFTVQKSSKINFGFDNWDCTHIENEEWFCEEDFLPLKKIKFEDYEFYAPNNIEKALRINYGNNYMSLPKTINLNEHCVYRSKKAAQKKIRTLNKRIVLSRIKRKFFKDETKIYKDKYKKYKALLEFILTIIDIKNVLPTKNKVLRKYQLDITKFAKQITDFFDKNGLEYFLSSGNLIGALRHGGFVPWDDDIDFGMMRKDYEKLKNILHNNYKEIDASKIIPSLYNKDSVVDKALRESHGEIIFYDGPKYIQIFKGSSLRDSVLVDIFVHDYYKDNYTWNDHKKYMREIVQQSAKFNNCRDIRNYLQKTFKSNPNVVDESETIYYGIDSYGSYIVVPKNLMNKSIIFPRSKVMFEGYEFYAPNAPEEYIKIQYPNFWEMPKNFEIAPDLKDKLHINVL